MELDGLGEDRVKSVDVTVFNESEARVTLNWECWPLNEPWSFYLYPHHTLDDLREILQFELLNINSRINELTNK